MSQQTSVTEDRGDSVQRFLSISLEQEIKETSAEWLFVPNFITER